MKFQFLESQSPEFSRTADLHSQPGERWHPPTTSRPRRGRSRTALARARTAMTVCGGSCLLTTLAALSAWPRATGSDSALHPPLPNLRPIPIKASWAWSVYEPTLQPWAARAKTFTNLGLQFHQPGLNIHTQTSGGDELLVQGNPGGQVLRSTDGGGSFMPLCPRPDLYDGSGVGILHDGTLLAATNQEQVLTKTFIVAHTTVHRAEISRSADTGDVTRCVWVNATKIPPLFAGDSVGGNAALRFSQADDGTVYFMISNDRRARNPNHTLPPEEDYSFGVVYASTDYGRSFQYRGSPARYTSENDILPLGNQSLLAAVRLQDETGLRSATLPGPHYKQSAITKSTDAGRSWSPLRVLTGYLQQSPSLVVHPTGLLLCIFGHKDGWPINNTQINGWQVVGGQRFIVSLDGGQTWSRTVFELHRGGLYGSSVVLSNGTIVTAFGWNATAAARGDGGGDSPSLGLLHWEPPSKEEVSRGGFFTPVQPNFASAVGPPYPAKKPAGALQTPYNGETFKQQTWGNYIPELFQLLDVQHISTGIVVNADPTDRPIVQIGPQGEVMVQMSRQNGTIWRSTDSGVSFTHWCATPSNSVEQRRDGMCVDTARGECGRMGYVVLDDGSVLAAVISANATQIHVYRSRYDESRRECSWDEKGTELPPLPPGHKFAQSSIGRFKDLGGGRVLFPLTANEKASGGGDGGGGDRGASYGLLYETIDYGRSWVMRGMIGKLCSEIDVLPLDSPDSAIHSGLIAAARYQTSGDTSQTMPLPMYKQTVIQYSSDSGFTWSVPKLVTGYMQHTASMIKLSDGTLVLPFSHQPPVTQLQAAEEGNRMKGWSGVDYWQRFIVSFDNGSSWCNRIFSLYTGGTEASSTVLANDTILTVFSTAVEHQKDDDTSSSSSSAYGGWWQQGQQPRKLQLELLRWRLPPREVISGNGYFRPPSVLTAGLSAIESASTSSNQSTDTASTNGGASTASSHDQWVQPPAHRLQVSCVRGCEVGLGQTLELHAVLNDTRRLSSPPMVPGVPAGLKIWAFVNGTQWGAPVTPPATQLLLPLPHVGHARVQLVLLPLTAFPSADDLPIKSHRGFPVGTAVEDVVHVEAAVRSNELNITVYPRVVAPPAERKDSDPLVLIEWESEFSVHYNTWVSREATPLCGLYSSYHSSVHRQHALWLVEAGVDAVLLDWVDTLFHAHPHFDSNPAGAEDMDASVATMQTWATMRSEGLRTPLAVPLLGLDNGNPGTVAPAKLQQQVEWTGRALRDVYPELMLQVDGRPLLVIFDTTGTAQNGSYPGLRDVLNTSGWTVKWMSAFLNSPSKRFQSHTGYWSWTDGSAIPVRSMTADGSVESVTVKPAFFRTPGGAGSYTSPGGWLAPESQPQHQGSTLLLQMQAAMKVPRPKFVIVSQWNEFTATSCSLPAPDGGRWWPHKSCADTYNNTLTDDIEPTSLTECGDIKPGDERCGGYGFTALNYLRAAIWAALRHSTNPTGQYPCVLAIVTPDDESEFASGSEPIEITWRTLAPVAAGVRFIVQLDGVDQDCSVMHHDTVVWSCQLNSTRALPAGKHVLSVNAVGAWTQVDVSRDSFAPRLPSPATPRATVHIHVN